MCKRLFLFGLLSIVVVACRQQRSTAENDIRTVKVTTVRSVEYVDRDFAGMATADDAVNLAFRISGQVASVDVSKGDYVNKGQLLSQLDPRDVELQVASDKAQYERATSQYERMKRLLAREAVSQQEFEAAQTAYVQAKSIYENSKDFYIEKIISQFCEIFNRLNVKSL